MGSQHLDNSVDNKAPDDLLSIAGSYPVNIQVDTASLLPLLRALVASQPTPPTETAQTTWRERLWSCPAETRLNVDETAEALGHSRSWIYKHTSPKALGKSGATPLPHRTLEGSLMFVAGELRTWIRNTEQSVYELPMDTGLKLVSGDSR